MMEETPDGQTYFCEACEYEARMDEKTVLDEMGIKTVDVTPKMKHTCGLKSTHRQSNIGGAEFHMFTPNIKEVDNHLTIETFSKMISTYQSNTSVKKQDLLNYFISSLTKVIEQERERILKEVKKIKTRKPEGNFIHIEVYRDKIITKIQTNE